MTDVIGPARSLIERVRAEYLEMPGLRLTERQAQRLFGLNAFESRQVLRALLQSGFLRLSLREGRYRRVAA